MLQVMLQPLHHDVDLVFVGEVAVALANQLAAIQLALNDDFLHDISQERLSVIGRQGQFLDSRLEPLSSTISVDGSISSLVDSTAASWAAVHFIPELDLIGVNHLITSLQYPTETDSEGPSSPGLAERQEMHSASHCVSSYFGVHNAFNCTPQCTLVGEACASDS